MASLQDFIIQEIYNIKSGESLLAKKISLMLCVYPRCYVTQMQLEFQQIQIKMDLCATLVAKTTLAFMCLAVLNSLRLRRL